MKSNVFFPLQDFLAEDLKETPFLKAVWTEALSLQNIRDVFDEYIQGRSGPGADRVTADKFKQDFDKQAEIIQRKCLLGTYRFTPYLEQLISKGKGKSPRVISIPTIRDKIVLRLVKDFLHSVFYDCIARDLPNTIIKKAVDQVKKDHELRVIKVDVSSFYDSICHEKLFSMIQPKLEGHSCMPILWRAIRNPTLSANYPKASRKEAKNIKGVPQGLAISNILAEIFMKSFDEEIKACSSFYIRFVDDVLIFCKMGMETKIWEGINAGLQGRDLKANVDKTTPVGQSVVIDSGLSFLGYHLSGNKVSVCDKSYNRLVHSVLGIITRFKYAYKKADKPSRELELKAFIHELNERITGAIDGRRRYGWVFFFSEIDNTSLLHQIDRIIGNAVDRMGVLSPEERAKIKKIARAHFEAKHTPLDGYIHDYGRYETLTDKIQYLLDTKKLTKSQDGSYDEKLVIQLFDKTKKANLLKLDRDVGMFS